MSDASNKVRLAEKQAVLLEEDLALLEAELSDRYYQLGKCVYEAADRRIEEIGRLVDRLVETRVKLSGVKEQTVCLSCLAPNPRDNAYCGKCGTRLEPPDDE